ncbi:MAG TPA: hypothetical protein PLI51_09925 [bacterium]|nr:hypothetical protein [bacterium]HPQ67030.1 hypothetical protein [bacterium]
MIENGGGRRRRLAWLGATGAAWALVMGWYLPGALSGPGSKGRLFFPRIEMRTQYRILRERTPAGEALFAYTPPADGAPARVAGRGRIELGDGGVWPVRLDAGIDAAGGITEFFFMAGPTRGKIIAVRKDGELLRADLPGTEPLALPFPPLSGSFLLIPFTGLEPEETAVRPGFAGDVAARLRGGGGSGNIEVKIGADGHLNKIVLPGGWSATRCPAPTASGGSGA